MDKRVGLHEDFHREDVVKGGSERAFGLVFAIVFGVVGLWPMFSGNGPRLWSLVVAAAFASIAVAYPRALKPFNRLWFRFGLLLHRFMSPAVLGFVYVTTVIPVGLVMRLCGKDPLHRRSDPDAATYWIPREPPGPGPESLHRQF